MKKLFRILAYTAGVLAVLVAGFVGYVNWKFNHLPPYELKGLPIKAVSDSAVVAKGGAIVSIFCANCHIGNDGTLSGHIFSEPKDGYGTIWASNLTRNPKVGIGRYSDSELAATIRSGIDRNGRYLGPFMAHPLLSDDDLTAIVSFLRSDTRLTQPSEITHPASTYAFIGKALFALKVFQPLPQNSAPIATPPAQDTLAFGKYLVDVRFVCSNCHSASFETNDPLIPEKSKGYLAGGTPVIDPQRSVTTLSANLTPDPETGLGTWRYEQFEQAVRGGLKPDHSGLSPAMPRFSILDDGEVKAIWAYLQTVPAARHVVNQNSQNFQNAQTGN